MVLFAIMIGTPPLAWAADVNKCPLDPGNSLDGADGEAVISRKVALAFLGGSDGKSAGDPKFVQLKLLADQMASTDCKFLDGRHMLGQFTWGLEEAFRAEARSLSLSKLIALRKAYPKEAFPIIAEVTYWVLYASEARGTGYANSVTKDGRKLFVERMNRAAKILTENEAVAQKSPEWFGLMIATQNALGVPFREQAKVFSAGAKSFKTYLPNYIAMRNYLEPKWGGSWELLDQFAAWAADNTKETEGSSFYVRLYYGVYMNLQQPQRLFQSTKASWGRMEEGCKDLVARYPRSRDNLNICASLACEAAEKKTYLAYRNLLGSNIKTRNVESCDAL